MILNNIGRLGMIMVGQRYIECPVSQVRDANTSDLTHSTGTQGIVSLHAHDHGNGGDITKGCDKIGMEGEAVAREGIICGHTDCKLEQFSHKWMDERVCIPWLFWTRYYPNTKDVVPLEAFVWGEIVIENKEDPRSMLLLLEWSKAIGGEAECDIMLV